MSTWSLSVCTVDGKRFVVGDRTSAENFFPLNELCYLLNYCLACETLEDGKLKNYFASKPIPRDRDEFSLHSDGRVWNPLCRAGGLLLSSFLFQPGLIFYQLWYDGLNSNTVGMAVARPYGFEIDFVRNRSYFSSSCMIFRYCVKFILTPIFEIKISEWKFFGTKKSFLKADFH